MRSYYMTCYFPLQAYRGKSLTSTGKRSIVFNPNDSISTSSLFQLQLPCGRCIGCRLERSRQWAIRCMHEASLYANNCFITLTYNDASLPSDLSLNVKHFQDFMKRLRKKFGDGIRFYHCGEYGDKYGRPHYHACIFNLDFEDKVIHSQNKQGQYLFVSETLNKIWGKGYCIIGSLTFDSAAYVARYVMKKVTGNPDTVFHHYNTIDYLTGEITRSRKPEYNTMSRRPGIAKAWFDKYKSDVFPRDYVVISNKKVKPPKFYLNQLELTDPSMYISIKDERKKLGVKFRDDNTPDRLAVKHEIKQYHATNLTRDLDKDL